MLNAMKKLVDPRTKQSTAFYALLGIAGWDAITRGFNRFNAALLAALAVPGLLGFLASVWGGKLQEESLKREDPPKDSPP